MDETKTPPAGADPAADKPFLTAPTDAAGDRDEDGKPDAGKPGPAAARLTAPAKPAKPVKPTPAAKPAKAVKPARATTKAGPADDDDEDDDEGEEDAPPRGIPTRRFRVHCPKDRTMPPREVAAVTVADAKAKYCEELGIITPGHPLVAAGID